MAGMISGNEQRRRQRSKNIALGLILLGLVVLFYLITIVKMGAA
jgi:hypothetical protein